MKKKLLALFSLFVFLTTSGFGCAGASPDKSPLMKKVTITWWRVYDDEDSVSSIIDAYKKLHPNVTIEYKKFRYDEYEKALLNALAEQRGPDIFSIPSSWLNEYKPKITPMPDNYKLAYPVTTGTIKKEVTVETRVTNALTLKDLKKYFVDVVNDDVVIPDEKNQPRIYGLPLYVDTMAMFYNQDLLNNAGIPEAPLYWDDEFQKDVEKLTKVDSKGNIVQSGVGLGGSANIERPADILALLMMQNGAEMVQDGSVNFQSGDHGIGALRFYTDFSNPLKKVYCWNNNLDDSLTLFSQGNLAMTFGYSYDLPTIKANNPKLNFSIAPMPQLGDENNAKQINYANYWVETVSKQSANPDFAWNFIQFAASDGQRDNLGNITTYNVESYLKTAQKPTALRALVKSQTDDINLGVFSQQVLTAKSWYHGNDALAEENAFGEMIDLVNKGDRSDDSLSTIIKQASDKVQQTFN